MASDDYQKLEKGTGTIVRGADGSLYFIREDVLEACKITDEEMTKFCADLLKQHSDVKGFTLASGPVGQALTFTGPIQKSPDLSAFDSRASTVMCPGTMGLRDPSFKIIR